MRNKIKFGMPTLIEKPKINECVALCKELGLDFIEIKYEFASLSDWEY